MAEMFKFFVLNVAVLCMFCYGCIGVGQSVNINFNDSVTNVGNRIKTECAGFLQTFANATQRFNLCIVKHGKPLRMCEKCTSQYTELVNRDPVGFNSSICVDDLVKSERFQVVMKVYDFQTGLWKSANCYKCYESNWNMTHDTREFFHRHHIISSCFENYTALHQNDNSSNNSLCSVCRPHYLKLRRVYDRILDETTDDKDEDKICVDIMSLMNDTRKDWTKFGCNKVKEKNLKVLSLTGLLCFLMFIYYTGVRKHEKYKNKIQTRSQRAKQVVNYDSE